MENEKDLRNFRVKERYLPFITDGQWDGESYWDGDEREERVKEISMYEVTSANGKNYLDLNCAYMTFETEKEAAEAFLQEIEKFPNARVNKDTIEYAKKLLHS